MTLNGVSTGYPGYTIPVAPTFYIAAIISGMGLLVWNVYSQGPSEQKAIKNFGQKEAWGCPKILSTPYYLRNW